MPTVQEVIKRSEQGVNRPFICRADNGETYFVKGRGAGYLTMIREMVAGQLGTMFELPVPPVTILHVPSELISDGGFPEIANLGSGPAFASQFVKYTQEFSTINSPTVSQALRGRTFLFDWWIQNEDRTLVNGAGNPNLLWRAQDQSMHVIDHTSAFDPEFDPKKLLRNHVFREDRFLLLDQTVRREAIQAMRGIVGKLPQIWNGLPEEWTDPDIVVEPELVLDEIKLRNILLRFETEQFWELS